MEDYCGDKHHFEYQSYHLDSGDAFYHAQFGLWLLGPKGRHKLYSRNPPEHNAADSNPVPSGTGVVIFQRRLICIK